MTRREAREEAFLLLFEHGFKDDGAEDNIQLAEDSREMKINEFGKGLYLGTVEKLELIDAKLEDALHNWRGDRISRVARAALRLCVYEMLFTDTETEIVINEALEIIKRFDGAESAAFANGVLGGVYRATEKGE